MKNWSALIAEIVIAYRVTTVTKRVESGMTVAGNPAGQLTKKTKG